MFQCTHQKYEGLVCLGVLCHIHRFHGPLQLRALHRPLVDEQYDNGLATYVCKVADVPLHSSTRISLLYTIH